MLTLPKAATGGHFYALKRALRGSILGAHYHPKSPLIDNLKELHLPAMRSGFEEVARLAPQESQSYERY
jgi:hypothetical protein